MGKSKTARLDTLPDVKELESFPPSPKDVAIEEDKVELTKELGLPGGISFIVGCIVGSGIFVSPKGVLEGTGSVGLSLCVWVGAGLIALTGSLCYCELGTLISKSGGEYTYIRTCYGELAGFICSWVSFSLVRPSSLAIMSLTFGTYFTSVFDTCGSPDLLVKLAGIACLVTVMLLNCYSIRLATRIQIVTTVAKVLALCVIIVGGIIKMTQGYTKEIQTGFQGSTANPTVIALAFYDALWAYDGWNNLNMVIEEVKNPSKNLPRANIVSLLIVIIIYALTNVCYITVMTKDELLNANAVAELWGERVLGTAAILIPLSVMISTFGSINATSFSGGRMIFAAARDGNLPEVLSFVSVKQRTPLTSMIFTNALAVIFVLLGDISSLVDFFSFTAWLFYAMCFASVIIFRFKYFKDHPRPYKVPLLIPVIMLLVSAYLIIAPIVQNPSLGYLYAVIFSFAGSILYFPLVYYKLRIPYVDKLTTYAQLLLEISPTSKVD